MKEFYLLIIFTFLVFISPIHFFIIGDGNGYGIQGFFYRYQIAPQAISFIPITNEVGYVTSGLIEGKSAISILLWTLGTLFFYLSFFLFLLKFNSSDKIHYQYVGITILISCALFILSSLFQYGIFFSGPAGISILIGVPFLFYFGLIFIFNFKKKNWATLFSKCKS